MTTSETVEIDFLFSCANARRRVRHVGAHYCRLCLSSRDVTRTAPLNDEGGGEKLGCRCDVQWRPVAVIGERQASRGQVDQMLDG